jgi:glycerophosphoryl diester phosphodiesterase
MSYFDSATPRIFAHRGSTGEHRIENTIAAFREALALGADYIETDVRATKDGIAILLHDGNLLRLGGSKEDVADLDFEEVQRICRAANFEVATLRDAFTELPDAKFNLDIKHEAACEPTAEFINEVEGFNRVLVSSFSSRRSRATHNLLRQKVAKSGSAQTAILCWLICKLNLPTAWLSAALDGSIALQVPVKQAFINFADERMILRLRKLGVETHFWVINSAEQAKKLVSIGAAGIVTDDVKLIVATLR